MPRRGYKVVAQIAETYVFVYLGMAVFTFPIFESTTYMLVFYATMACFVGRLHIYVDFIMTNCFRSEGDVPPPSPPSTCSSCGSRLRGGVAFALASISSPTSLPAELRRHPRGLKASRSTASRA